MMTIEKEIEKIVDFLNHPAGFDVGMGGVLCIRPIDENSPPHRWEVDWEEQLDGMRAEFYKEFDDLQSAAQFFVERRRLMCEGLDFVALTLQNMKEDDE